MRGIRQSLASSIAICIAVGLCVSAFGDGLGPEMYGIPGSFGLGAPTPTRELGMGAVMTCVNDQQFANPAFAAIQQTASAGVRATTTSLDHGPRLTSLMLQYSQPIRPNETGMQLTVLTLGSTRGGIMFPQIGPVDASMTETGFVVDYGRRLSHRFTAGLGVLGSNHVGLSFTPPLEPALLNLSDKTDFGARVGATYEYSPGDYLGLIYSYSQDTVDASGLLLGPPASVVFHDDQLVIGASRHFGDRFLGAIEFNRGTEWRSPFSSGHNAWQFGLEYQACPGCAVRAGIADGSPTLGLGYHNDRWSIDYAYIHNWNDDSVGDLFGSSKTQSLEVAYKW